MILNLDKTTWKRVAFGDVIENVTDRVDNPSRAGVERYVGLEHLDPGVLTVQRWGRPDKVEAQKLRFAPGDVIFGRRRAYQKKVALAKFEGICSAHALVLRARPNYIHPEFLPVLLASDYFLDRAISISVGSLSPTVNWRDLKVQELELPPLDEQKRLADLLWSAEAHRAAVMAERAAISAARSVWLAEAVIRLLDQATVPFGEVWSRSPRSGWSAPPVDEPTGRYVLSLAALGPDGYRPGQLKNVVDSAELRSALLEHGDLLISRANTVDTVGRVGIFTEDRDDVSFPDTMMRIHLVDDVRPQFAAAVLSSPHGRAHMRRTAAGSATSMVKINRRSLATLLFPHVAIDQQEQLLEKLFQFDNSLGASEKVIAEIGSIRTSLLAQIFEGAA